jgi:hypothetical protein
MTRQAAEDRANSQASAIGLWCINIGRAGCGLYPHSAVTACTASGCIGCDAAIINYFGHDGTQSIRLLQSSVYQAVDAYKVGACKGRRRPRLRTADRANSQLLCH